MTRFLFAISASVVLWALAIVLAYFVIKAIEQ